MKNQQIKKSTKAKPRTEQQLMSEIRRRKLAFIEEQGSKDQLRELDLVLNMIAGV